MAEGIASAGVGIGTFLLTIFYQFLINTYDWKVICFYHLHNCTVLTLITSQGAIAIAGAISLHLAMLHQLLISPNYLMEFPRLRDWKIAGASKPSNYKEGSEYQEPTGTEDDTEAKKKLRNSDNNECTQNMQNDYRISYHAERNKSELITKRE